MVASKTNRKYLTDLGHGGAIAADLGKRVAQSKGSLSAVFDATGGKAIGSHTLYEADADGNPNASLPDNAIITRAWYDVLTTFTSATDAATIALTSNAAGDLKVAIAISNGANPWDAGLIDAIPQGDDPATFVKMSADRNLVATVAVEALTAGKLRLYVEYVLSE